MNNFEIASSDSELILRLAHNEEIIRAKRTGAGADILFEELKGSTVRYEGLV